MTTCTEEGKVVAETLIKLFVVVCFLFSFYNLTTFFLFFCLTLITARITSVYKFGGDYSPQTLRPVSVQAILFEMFEYLMNNRGSESHNN